MTKTWTAKKRKTNCRALRQIRKRIHPSRKAKLVLLQALADQIKESNVATCGQKNTANGWRCDIRFLECMIGMWKRVALKVHKRYGVPNSYSNKTIGCVLTRMQEVSSKNSPSLCVSVCPWILRVGE